MKPKRETPAASTASPQRGTVAPSPSSLAALVAVGATSALWALFAWTELARVRSGGGHPFCPLAEPDQCRTLWDAAFPTAVQRMTGMPLAGWGLVWSLAAFALALAALVRRAESRPVDALVTAIRTLSAAVVLVVFVLLAVITAEGRLCLSCFTAHLLAGVYAAIALVGWRRLGLPDVRRGLALAFVALLVAYVLLLYPGHRTPSAGSAASAQARAIDAGAEPRSAGESASDATLESFVASLDPGLQQTLSDSLLAYRDGLDRGRPKARFLIGSEDAPVRFTEFTDVRCDHCAALHRTLARLRERFGDGRFSVEPRQFPLDGECNPAVARRSDPVRCLAAKALICMEGRAGYLDYSAALFERQKSLSAEQVVSLAAPHLPRAELQACLASPETARKLAADVELALAYKAEGTPLVLVNGRRAVSFAPFLFAIVLTQGAADRPAFANLPPPDPSAQVY